MNPCRRLNLNIVFSFFRVLVLVSLVGGAAPDWAQLSSAGTVSGLVTDQQNAAVPGAEVKLTDTSTNSSQSTITNEAGRYVFATVPPGVYQIEVGKEGFARAKVTGKKVEVGTVLTINVSLEIGSTLTMVEVQATAGAELQTANAAIGTTLSGDALIHLPNLGRDVTSLIMFQPGVSSGVRGGGYIAGAYNDQNTFLLDGGNNTDDMAGNTIGYQTNFTGLGGSQTNGISSGIVPTPVESIEEFKVTTFNQTADFNSSIGGEIQMVTKRGSNDWHGAAYGYYFATNVGAANSWKNNHTPINGQDHTPLPSNHRNRFGAAVGGPMAPPFLGGKTYFFFNYEGLRFPNVGTYERLVPSTLLRAGIVQIPDSSGKWIPYNLNPAPATVNGTTYAPSTCPAGACDPRNLGMSPVVRQIWNQQMPLPNDPLFGDQFNTQGFYSVLRAPLTSNSYVARIDHDFSEKWRFFGTYRYMKLLSVTSNQVDIGGVLPGDSLGVPAAVAPRPQVPSFWVAGLTTNITPTTTNDFRFNYTRNFWQWGSANAPPQLPGLGGAVEMGGESNSTVTGGGTNALIPYNVNTQNVRQRFWDGQDKLIRDDVSMIKGNHLFQFGGMYQRNYDYHMRTDNGNGINNQIVYQITNSGINFTNSPYIPTTVPSNQLSNYSKYYSMVLGLVNQPQVAYARSGANLNLQPVGSVAYEQSIIPYYNVYFTDTWHLRPTLTLNYGLSYTLEMPPYELTGKQVMTVGADGELIGTADYLAQRKAAALAGSVYNPIIGFATVKNVGKGIKYPYDPFYGQFSPRISAAWNPRFDSGVLGALFGRGKTVLRGGYSRIFGRINGVNQVLVPLLGIGPLQPSTCAGASRTGQCLGDSNVDPATAFRIGFDGLSAPLPAPSPSLAQPYFSGVNGAIAGGDVNTLDPHYRPERTDNVSFTLQRELSSKMMLEVGYIGRIIRNEFQEINLDAVPYMTTLGGQTFAKAYAAMYTALVSQGMSAASVPVQPFFEAALGGAGSAYCTGFASCTAAVASKNASLFKFTRVSDIWANLNKAPSWVLGRTMLSGGGGNVSPLQATSVGLTTSLGFGNYNALIVSWRARDYHGFTAISNFTWGRALGTAALAQYSSSNTALDPWNMRANYGPADFDIKFLYNAAVLYQPPYFKGQHGLAGHLLGGWTIAPSFTAQSGDRLSAGYSESCSCSQAFGEAASVASMNSSAENAVGAAPYTGGNSAHYNVKGSGGIGTANPSGLNFFADPAAVFAELRPCVLGIDTSCGGYFNLRNMPTWNLDATISKDIGVWREGRVGATVSFQFTNVLNHMQPNRPSLSLTSPTGFGVITDQINTPRNMEFGLRIHF
jgi:hypothetical protein